MAKEADWIKVVAKLNRLTLERELVWVRRDPPGSITAARNGRVFHFFGTRYRDKNIGIYEERYPFFTDEDTFHWDDRVVLAFYSDDWELQWELPRVAGIQDLYNTIRRRDANADKFAEELLKD